MITAHHNRIEDLRESFKRKMSEADKWPEKVLQSSIWNVNNIPTMQFLTGIFRNTQSKSYMLSLAECVWELRNSALWDTH